jgi:Arc/MetJ-type ribon-helix-helix transcriptional regulator
MTTLTVEFKGATEEVLAALVNEGYAKTKSEALRYALLHLGEELDLIKPRFHVRSEEYAYREINKRRK